MKRVAILISGTGSNMVKLVQDMQENGYATPALVIADTPAAAGLDAARKLGVTACVIDYKAHGNITTSEEALHKVLQNAKIDLVCLAGFMRVLSTDFVDKWAQKILNIHPSLLPNYKGLNTHARVLEAGEAHHGCTVHWVTAGLDDGPILDQKQVRIAPNDTAQTLAQKVLEQEHKLYPQVLQAITASIS